MQIKELEDALAAAQQLSAQLQAEVQSGSASCQSQAADLAAAQTRCNELTIQAEAMQAQVQQAQTELGEARQAVTAQQALMASQEQQRRLRVCLC